MTTATETREAVPVPANSQLPAVGTAPALEAFFDVTEAGARLALLEKFFATVMVYGQDYGIIPGTKGKSLLKPGAEKLAEFYRLIQRPKVTHRVEDWTKPFFHYEVELDLVSRDSGQIVGTGMGSCNSMEARYRWRHGERKCPECGVAAIIKGKPEFGGGWLCFKRKDGCGAKFTADDPTITDQQFGKVENDDVYSLVNTILKMAKKRALVDAVVGVTRSAGILIEAGEEDDGAEHGAGDTPAGDKPAGNGTGATIKADDTITIEEHKKLADAFGKAGHDWAEVCAWAQAKFGIDMTRQRLPKQHYAEALERLSKPEKLEPF